MALLWGKFKQSVCTSVKPEFSSQIKLAFFRATKVGEHRRLMQSGLAAFQSLFNDEKGSQQGNTGNRGKE